ncbi:hypothetical protein K1719_039886 [Acacia pycnantha]|nr:hypothetical protein K1719_039886 [Acacia pycnantha]
MIEPLTDTSNKGKIQVCGGPEKVWKSKSKGGVDKDGHLDYGEFVAISIHFKKMGNDEHFHKAFQFFDKNNSGYIEIAELPEALAGITLADEVDTNNEVINAIMHDVDTDKVMETLWAKKGVISLINIGELLAQPAVKGVDTPMKVKTRGKEKIVGSSQQPVKGSRFGVLAKDDGNDDGVDRGDKVEILAVLKGAGHGNKVKVVMDESDAREKKVEVVMDESSARDGRPGVVYPGDESSARDGSPGVVDPGDDFIFSGSPLDPAL